MQDLTWGEYTPIAVGANMAKLAKEGINFAVAVEVPFFRPKGAKMRSVFRDPKLTMEVK